MLGKLLKYEMKASARTLLPLYIGTLVVAAICCVEIMMLVGNVNNIGLMDGPFATDSMVPVFTFLLFFALCVAIVVLTAVIIIQRFNKSLIGDEGYLMFTLPVTHTQLLSSKLIAGLLWVVIGTLVMGISAVIIWAPTLCAVPDMDWAGFWNEVQYLLYQYDPGLSIALTLGNSVMAILTTIMTVYLSIMIGQMEQCNKHRVVIAVVAFFLINWAFSMLGAGVLTMLRLDWSHFDVYNQMMGLDIVLQLLQFVVCFFATEWLMKKKLNL